MLLLIDIILQVLFRNTVKNIFGFKVNTVPIMIVERQTGVELKLNMRKE